MCSKAVACHSPCFPWRPFHFAQNRARALEPLQEPESPPGPLCPHSLPKGSFLHLIMRKPIPLAVGFMSLKTTCPASRRHTCPSKSQGKEKVSVSKMASVLQLMVKPGSAVAVFCLHRSTSPRGLDCKWWETGLCHLSPCCKKTQASWL